MTFLKKLILLILLTGVATVQADEFEETEQNSVDHPLWEVGLFNGVARLPHYRGSDEYKLYVVPLPYLIYRGKTFKADRDGVKGIFWKSDRFETGLSLSGNPPVPNENEARHGMPDLGAILELGPMLKYFITERDNPDPFILTAAARAAFSVDTGTVNIGYQGLRGGLKAVYRNRTWLQDQGVTLGVSASLDFAGREYNNYFYEVEPVYATVDRPAYRADAGYAGFSISMNASKKISDHLAVGTYYRWDNLSGAIYRGSPLVKTENNHIFGVALIWKIHRSETTVQR